MPRATALQFEVAWQRDQVEEGPALKFVFNIWTIPERIQAWIWSHPRCCKWWLRPQDNRNILRTIPLRPNSNAEDKPQHRQGLANGNSLKKDQHIWPIQCPLTDLGHLKPAYCQMNLGAIPGPLCWFSRRQAAWFMLAGRCFGGRNRPSIRWPNAGCHVRAAIMDLCSGLVDFLMMRAKGNDCGIETCGYIWA